MRIRFPSSPRGVRSGNAATDVFLYRPLQDTAQFDTNGWMKDLSGFIKDDGEFKWDDFGDAAQDAVTTEDDRIIAVPVATARQMLFYRKDLLEAAGVSVPTNLDELKAAAAALDKDNVSGICLRGQRAQAVQRPSPSSSTPSTAAGTRMSGLR